MRSWSFGLRAIDGEAECDVVSLCLDPSDDHDDPYSQTTFHSADQRLPKVVQN